MKVMLRAADVLADLVEAARDGKEIDESSYAAIASEVKALTVIEGQAEEVEEVIDFQPTVIDFGLPEITIDIPATPSHDYRINFSPAPTSTPTPTRPCSLARAEPSRHHAGDLRYIRGAATRCRRSGRRLPGLVHRSQPEHESADCARCSNSSTAKRSFNRDRRPGGSF